MAKTKDIEYAKNMRRALYDGMMKAARDKKMTITEYCASMWEEDWKAAMNAFAKFQPREVSGQVKHNHDHEHHHTHAGTTETTSFINEVLGVEETAETKH